MFAFIFCDTNHDLNDNSYNNYSMLSSTCLKMKVQMKNNLKLCSLEIYIEDFIDARFRNIIIKSSVI